MQIKRLRTPAIIISVGFILCIVVSLFTCIVKEPTITEHDFHFSVVYKLDGETKTLDGVYRSQYHGYGSNYDPLERFFRGSFLHVDSDGYTIAQKDGFDLRIVVIFSDARLMGDAEEDDYHQEPYLAVFDQQGNEYDYYEYTGVFQAEIVDWTYPEPVKNTFVFTGFSVLHNTSMLAMTLVGVLTIPLCAIFVKQDKTVSYKALDKFSVVLNFLVGFVSLPFFIVVAWMLALAMRIDTLRYQMYFCLPAFIAFSVAASISLRRKGFTKAGFFIQLVGPGLFALDMFREILYNIFA